MTDSPSAPAPTERKSPVKAVLTVVLIFFVIPFAALAILWKDRCRETTMAETALPDGSVVAAQIATDCGKTMQVATEVRLERRGADGKTLEDSAVVLILAGQRKLPITTSFDGITPVFTIDIPRDADVVKHRTEWSGVRIVFTGGPEPKTPRPEPMPESKG